MGDKVLSELFANVDTTLADIAEAGWRPYRSSSGSWWWEQPRDACNENEGFRRQPLPLWVRELLHDAEANGAERVRWEIKQALNIQPQKRRR